jgi:hypothetical protein
LENLQGLSGLVWGIRQGSWVCSVCLAGLFAKQTLVTTAAHSDDNLSQFPFPFSLPGVERGVGWLGIFLLICLFNFFNFLLGD